MGKTKKIESTDTEKVSLGNGKKLLAIVSGMRIYSDSIYTITGKSDECAPTGFQEYGIAKAPFPGNKSIVPCPWNSMLEVYDTGFFEKSSCYKGMGKEDVKEEVERRVQNIMNPYEEATGKDLHQKNFDLWDSFKVECYNKRLFYTNDINDLFDLYMALMSKLLTPKDEDGDPEFQNSMYCVEDSTTAVDVVKQRAVDKSDIIFEFMSKIKGEETDRRQIYDLLLYLDLIHSSEVDPSMVQYVFTNWIEKKNTNIDKYKEARNRFLNEDDNASGPQIIKFHRMIKELLYNGAIQTNGSGIIFKGEDLGSDPISASIRVVEDKNLLSVKADIVESYSAMKQRQENI